MHPIKELDQSVENKHKCYRLMLAIFEVPGRYMQNLFCIRR